MVAPDATNEETEMAKHDPCRICGHTINRNAAAGTDLCTNCKRWIKELGSEQALVAAIAKSRAAA